MPTWLPALALALALTLALAAAWRAAWRRWSLRVRKAVSDAPRKLCFVFAHPDDESLFFAPAMRCLSADGAWQVQWLCLSTGDADGKGAVRARELRESARLFGVPSDRVTLLDSPLFRDGMREAWPEDALCELLSAFASSQRVAALVGFDEHGISGHANHCAVGRALRRLAALPPRPGVHAPDVLLLETCALPRRYCGVLDLPLAALIALLRHGGLAPYLCVASPLWAARGLLRHRSQITWYRLLFLLFARQVVINSLLPLRVKSSVWDSC